MFSVLAVFFFKVNADNSIVPSTADMDDNIPALTQHPSAIHGTVTSNILTLPSFATSPRLLNIIVPSTAHMGDNIPLTQHLNTHPPTQKWIKNQFNLAKAMIGYSPYKPSKKKWKCGHTRHTYFFPNLKTIFTGVPKSGCSNWIEFLLRAEGALNVTLDPSEVDAVHTIYSNPYRFSSGDVSKQASLAYAKGFIFSFTVVRNPWTRLVSGYRDKLTPEESVGAKFYGKMRQIAKQMNLKDHIRRSTKDHLYPSFNQYTRWLVDNIDKVNSHFTPQWKTLCMYKAKYDFIVPLEYSDVLSLDIEQRLNTSMKLNESYDRSSDPRKQSSALRAKEWLSQLDPELVEKLYHLYKEDFALMNYSNFTHPDFPLPIVQH